MRVLRVTPKFPKSEALTAEFQDIDAKKTGVILDRHHNNGLSAHAGIATAISFFGTSHRPAMSRNSC